jgi:tRNA G18 (ribose-2'-O)-methylase SpoU
MTEITEISDARLADYQNVPDGELLERRGLFVAEGRLVVERLLASGRFPTRSVMVTEPAGRALEPVLRSRPDVPVYVVPQQVMNGVAGFDVHRGCLALGERPAPAPWQSMLVNARTVIVLERVGNPDNIGGVFRNAAALGGNAVLLDPASADPLYRKAIRTSMGAALQVPFARLDPWPDALVALRTAGFTLVGLTPAASAAPLSKVEAHLTEQRVAILLGHEGDGLTAEALAACTATARIPMHDGTDSVNVATAAALALYELQRQPRA